MLYALSWPKSAVAVAATPPVVVITAHLCVLYFSCFKFLRAEFIFTKKCPNAMQSCLPLRFSPCSPHSSWQCTAVFTVVYKTLIWLSAAMFRSVSSALGLFVCPVTIAVAVPGFIILKCKNILHCGLRHVRNASINTESEHAQRPHQLPLPRPSPLGHTVTTHRALEI